MKRYIIEVTDEIDKNEIVKAFKNIGYEVSDHFFVYSNDNELKYDMNGIFSEVGQRGIDHVIDKYEKKTNDFIDMKNHERELQKYNDEILGIAKKIGYDLSYGEIAYGTKFFYVSDLTELAMKEGIDSVFLKLQVAIKKEDIKNELISELEKIGFYIYHNSSAYFSVKGRGNSLIIDLNEESENILNGKNTLSSFLNSIEDELKEIKGKEIEELAKINNNIKTLIQKFKSKGIDISKTIKEDDGEYIFYIGEYEIKAFFEDDIIKYFFNNNIYYDIGLMKKAIDFKKNYNEYRREFMNQNQNEWVKKAKENPELLSNDKITSGTFIGGYRGKSMSNSAYQSEMYGSFPISKWNKKLLIDTILENTDELNYIVPILKKIPFSELKEICLYYDGYHHTGVFYNKTDFYAIESPRHIIEELIKRGLI